MQKLLYDPVICHFNPVDAVTYFQRINFKITVTYVSQSSKWTSFKEVTSPEIPHVFLVSYTHASHLILHNITILEEQCIS